MTEQIARDWSGVVGFKKEEFKPLGIDEPMPGGTVALAEWDMHSRLIHKLERTRVKAAEEVPGGRIQIVIKPNGGYAVTGHSDRSLHRGVVWERRQGVMFGRAADFSIQERDPVVSTWETWPWVRQAILVHSICGPEWGIGIYPHWKDPGLHLDWRGPGYTEDGSPPGGPPGGALVNITDRTPAVWTRDPAGKYKFYQFKNFWKLISDLCYDYPTAPDPLFG